MLFLKKYGRECFSLNVIERVLRERERGDGHQDIWVKWEDDGQNA